MCEDLAKSLRRRPTLPAHPDDYSHSWENLADGIALPEVSCSFVGCAWHGATEAELRAHVLGEHAVSFRRSCGEQESLWFDMYLGAIASIERKQIPAVGLSKDRQMMKKLTRYYKDEDICSLICIVCGQIKTKTPSQNYHIDWLWDGWFANLPNASKTLDANCGWELWCRQYGNTHPLNAYGPGHCEGAPRKDWCLEIGMCPALVQDIREPSLTYLRESSIRPCALMIRTNAADVERQMFRMRRVTRQAFISVLRSHSAVGVDHCRS